MATETAKFALELEDGISSSSESAENALQSLQSQIDSDTKALAQMKKAMRQMQAAGSVDIDAYRKLNAEIDSTQNSIGKARAAFVNLGGDFSKIGKKVKKDKIKPELETPKGLDDFAQAMGTLPNPLAKTTGGIAGLHTKIIGLSATVGVFATAVLSVVAILTVLVAVLAAVTVATLKATAAILKYAAAQADAMRSERLRLEGLGTLRRWMRLTGKDAAQMSESINRVSETVPLARSDIAGYGSELHRLGIRGRAAESALEALSLAQAVQGDRGRQRMMMLVRMAGHSEGAMANLAARVRKELGGVAARQMMSLSMISVKLKESFQAIFSGVNIEPLLSMLYRLSQLFSRNSDSGRALRAIMTALLGPFIRELGTATNAIEWFAKELVILALKAAIAFVRLRNYITRALGEGIIGKILKSKQSMEIFHIALITIGIAAVGLVAIIGVFIFLLIGAVTPLVLIAIAMYKGAQAGRKYADQIIVAIKTMQQMKTEAVQFGADLINGIIEGLGTGVVRLRAAIANVARQTTKAFRDTLGIRSPSRVFAQFGLAIPQGVSQGIDRGAPAASSSASRMVSTAASNITNVRGGASRAVQTGDIHIHVGAGAGGEDTATRIRNVLQDFFENDLATEAPQ